MSTNYISTYILTCKVVSNKNVWMLTIHISYISHKQATVAFPINIVSIPCYRLVTAARGSILFNQDYFTKVNHILALSMMCVKIPGLPLEQK